MRDTRTLGMREALTSIFLVADRICKAWRAGSGGKRENDVDPPQTIVTMAKRLLSNQANLRSKTACGAKPNAARVAPSHETV